MVDIKEVLGTYKEKRYFLKRLHVLQLLSIEESAQKRQSQRLPITYIHRYLPKGLCISASSLLWSVAASIITATMKEKSLGNTFFWVVGLHLSQRKYSYFPLSLLPLATSYSTKQSLLLCLLYLLILPIKLVYILFEYDQIGKKIHLPI